MTIETRLKKMEEKLLNEIAELKRLIIGKNLSGNWVIQSAACDMLNIKPRRLRQIRKHVDKDGKAVGEIRWRKGKGKSIQYYRPDLEKYLSQISIP